MASPNDLTSLADLKSWLGIASTDEDTLLAGLISDISRAILTHLDRSAILPSTYTEVLDGGNEVSVMLRHWPVNAILSCSVDGVWLLPAPLLVAGAAAQAGYVLEAIEPAPPGQMQRLSLRRHLFKRGLQNVVISYTAGYQVATEAAIVPAAGSKITALAPYGAWATDAGVVYAQGDALTPVASAPSAGQYTVSAGAYTFAAADAGAGVLLTYGYIPADLAHCCRDWAAERYSYRDRIGQSSKSLGGQETIAFIVKDIPDFVVSALQPYRRVVTP